MLEYEGMMTATKSKTKYRDHLEAPTRVSRVSIPKSWYAAAGLLRHKGKALDRHLQRVRKEWSR